MTARQRRFLLLTLVLALLAGAGALLLRAFQSNLVFFVTPTQVARNEVDRSGLLRLGGMVVPGSVQRDRHSLFTRFALTDNLHQQTVVYEGVLPDLFLEGKGAIAQGRLDAHGILKAEEVLAKHDENYMPPAVHDALQQGSAAAAALAAASVASAASGAASGAAAAASPGGRP